jgi:hypothetical protein
MSISGDKLETHIKGTFRGWKNDAVFKLVNGQTWEQSKYAYRYHYAYRPAVIIIRTGSGYEMSVEGMDDTVPVKRIK